MSGRIIPAVRTIAMTKARNNLGELIKRVHNNKEYFILEKDGVPVVAIIDIDEFEDYLELNDPKARREIEKSNEDIRAGRTRPARELLAELRAAESRAPKRSKGRKPHTQKV